MVDTFFSEDYLKKYIESDVQVVDVRRMKKRVNDREGNSIQVDRQSVVLSFLGSTIPNRVIINSVVFPVERYVYPVVQCFNCLFYGHTAKLCKAKQRCKGCSEVMIEGHTCEVATYCIHCKSSDHVSINRKCPQYTRQMNIKKIMSAENMFLKEAEKLSNNPSYAKIATSNRFSILANSDNFPSLPPTSTGTNFIVRPKNYQQPRSLTQPLVKKRKPCPPSPSSPTTSLSQAEILTSKSAAPIIPNPHREDFITYKNELAEKLALYLIDTIKKLAPFANVNSTEQDCIKNEISLICGKSFTKTLDHNASKT